MQHAAGNDKDMYDVFMVKDKKKWAESKDIYCDQLGDMIGNLIELDLMD